MAERAGADGPSTAGGQGHVTGQDEAPVSYGERQRVLRLARRLSVRQLAEMTGLAFGYLARVERGDDAPPGEQAILRIAEALGASEDELLQLAHRPHPALVRAATELPPEGRLFFRRAADRQLSPAEWRRLTELIDRPTIDEGGEQP